MCLLLPSGPAAHSTPLPRQRLQPAERDQAEDYGEEEMLQEAPSAIHTAPHPSHSREAPIRAPRMHTAPIPAPVRMHVFYCDGK